jgi:hypothetical protein
MQGTWNQNAVIRVFLNGFTMDQTTGTQSDYTLSLSNATTDGNYLYVDVSKNSSIKISNVRVSYIIYNSAPVNYILLVSDNAVHNMSGRQTTNLNPENRTLIPNQFLFGITGFSVRGAIRISVNINYGPTTTTAKVNAISYTTILISRPVTEYCNACPAGSQLQGLSCISCPNFSSWQSNACTCNSGYVNVSGICQQCPSGTAYNSATSQCVTICQSNSIWQNGQCQCNSGFYNISGTCQQCPSGTSFNNGQCTTICQANSTWFNGKCVCNQGLVNNNGVCQSCPPGTYLLG